MNRIILTIMLVLTSSAAMLGASWESKSAPHPTAASWESKHSR